MSIDVASGPSAPPDLFPRYRPVAAHGLLVEFGEVIDNEIHARVLKLDDALKAAPFDGFTETVPAYASVLVCFDPLVTDHKMVEVAIADLVDRDVALTRSETLREVEVCYDADLAPDLAAVAGTSGLTPEYVVAAHLAGDYSVFMYGFAPGFAYLAGVPPLIQLPRKRSAVRGVPVGSVLIAGPQCLITTLVMPTGWWIVGRSPTKILDLDSNDRPFLFDVGDRVRFRRISRAEFDTEMPA